MSKMTVDDWVEFYLENPDELRNFIAVANEQASRMAQELNSRPNFESDKCNVDSAQRYYWDALDDDDIDPMAPDYKRLGQQEPTSQIQDSLECTDYGIT